MTSNIIVFNRELLSSPAFRSLKGSAWLVYLDFLGKRKIQKIGKHKTPTIINNKDITYYYSEAEKKGISRKKFRDAIDELIKKGFIDIFHQGQGYQKDKTLYELVDRWRLWDTPHFEEKTRTKDTRQGKGFQKDNQLWMKKRAKGSV